MVVCPVAITLGCKSCPIVKVCPAKEIIGNYKKEQGKKPNDDKPKK